MCAILTIGLGNMGMAISRRLHECGRDVIAIDLDETRRRQWRETTGRPAAASLADVGLADIDRVFLQVRLTEQARDVLAELRALPLRPGTRIFLVTTLEIPFARMLGDYQIPGVELIESPVSGADVRARKGSLTVLVAGARSEAARSEAALSEADERFLTDTIATDVIRFDRYGEPALAKLLNNTVAAYNVRTLCEIFHLASRLGLEPRRLYDVILRASGGSFVATIFPELVDDLLDKDVTLIRDYVGELPTVSLAADSRFRSYLASARKLLNPAAEPGS